MKVLTIGNSHIGAMLSGWVNIKDKFSGTDIYFIGAPAQRLLNAETKNGKVVNISFTSEGSDLPLKEFDAFIVRANLLNLHSVASFLNEKYSQKVQEATIRDGVEASLSVHVLEHIIRPHSTAPVFMLSMPERRRSSAEKYKISEAQYARCIAAMSRTINRYHNVTYIPQAPSTLNEYFLPKEEYYSGAVGVEGSLIKDKEKGSIWHMNALGGGETMKDIMKHLQQVISPAK